MVENTDDKLGGGDRTSRTNDDDEDVYESITCVSQLNSNSDFETHSNTLQLFDNTELPIQRQTEALSLNIDESDSSALSELSITDHPFLASDNSEFDTIEVDVPSLLRSGKKTKAACTFALFYITSSHSFQIEEISIIASRSFYQQCIAKEGIP